MKRRALLTALGAVVASMGAVYWQRNALFRLALTSRDNDVQPTFAARAGDETCVLTPEQIEGPYYIKSKVRSFIAEDQSGLPLELLIEVVGMPDCSPVEGVTVEIWHCNPQGAYSGYGDDIARAPFEVMRAIAAAGGGDVHLPSTETTTYLRGAQFTDVNGHVRFQSIFPGWYEPRVAHIHLKVSKQGQSFLTTQLYFADEMVNEIYGTHPDYIDYGLCPYDLTNDVVLSDLKGGTGVIVNANRLADKVQASIRIGLP